MERVGQVKVTGLKGKLDELAEKVGADLEKLLVGKK